LRQISWGKIFWVELPDFPLRPARSSGFERWARHARFDDARADGVDADAGPSQLEAAGLHDRDHRRLGGGVVGRAGIGTEAVQMIEPEGFGFDADVICMAGVACLTVRKTL
jgi:hypothetical protein